MPMSIGGKFRHGGDRVILQRHERPSLWHAGLAKDIEDLWEPWMREAVGLLEDAALVESVYEAQGKRHPQSRSRGRAQTPAEVALRLLILKHVRNWSYDTLEREVRANLVYRAFTRIGDEKVPVCKDLGAAGTSDWSRSDPEFAPAADGIGTRARDRGRTTDAGGYDGGGNEHSLSH